MNENGASGTSDIEGKAESAAASEFQKRAEDDERQCKSLIRYVVEAVKQAKRPAGARGIQEACMLVFSLAAMSAAQIS